MLSFCAHSVVRAGWRRRRGRGDVVVAAGDLAADRVEVDELARRPPGTTETAVPSDRERSRPAGAVSSDGERRRRTRLAAWPGRRAARAASRRSRPSSVARDLLRGRGSAASCPTVDRDRRREHAARAGGRRAATSAPSTAGLVGPIGEGAGVALAAARARRAPGARASSRWMPMPDFGCDLDDLGALEAQPAVDEALAGLRRPTCRAPRRASPWSYVRTNGIVVVAHPAQHRAAELARAGCGSGRRRRAGAHAGRARRRAARWPSGSSGELGASRPARVIGVLSSRRGAPSHRARAPPRSDIPLASTSPIATPGQDVAVLDDALGRG